MNFQRYKTLWILLPILAILVFSEIAMQRRARDSESPERVAWQTNLPAAQDQARKEGKLVFIDITATWCGPCQSLKQTLWNDAEVAAAIAARFVPVRIDFDQQRDVADKYVHEGIPAFVILTPDGKEEKFSEGAVGKADFLKWIDLTSQRAAHAVSGKALGEPETNFAVIGSVKGETFPLTSCAAL